MGGGDGCGFSAGPDGGRALLRHTCARATPARAASMSAGQAVKVFAQPAKKVIHHTHISVTKVRARWPCRARELARSLARALCAFWGAATDCASAAFGAAQEIAMGLGLGLIAGLGWKQYHWHYMKEKKAWYDGVAAGKINPFAEAAVEIEE